jgi:hypothetical protein
MLLILITGLQTDRNNLVVGSIITFAITVLLVAVGLYVISPLSLIFIAVMFFIAASIFYKNAGEMS